MQYTPIWGMVRRPAADAQVHLTGGCQCGAVRYAVTDEPLTAATCHCRDCQYSSGGAPAHALIFPAGSVTLLRGQAKEHRYKGDSGHTVMRLVVTTVGRPLASVRSTTTSSMSSTCSPPGDTSPRSLRTCHGSSVPR